MILFLNFYRIVIKSLMNIWLCSEVMIDNYMTTNLGRTRKIGLILIFQVSE